MSIVSDFLAKFELVTDTLLASGPDVQADLEDLGEIKRRLEAIYVRSARRFGLAAAPPGISPDQLDEAKEDPRFKACCDKISAKLGHGAASGVIDSIVSLVQMILNNPTLGPLILQIIVSLLQKKA